MSRLPFVPLVVLLVPACGGSGGGGSTGEAPASSLEVAALRDELFVAGVEPIPEPPLVSGALFELGRALFFDKLLSGSQDISCATCHLPGFATGDGRTLSDGVHGLGLGPDRGGGAIVPRNSPALFALHLKRELFWDGRVGMGANGLVLPAAVALPDPMLATFVPGLEVAGAQAMLPPVSREEMRGEAGDNPLGDLGDGYNSSGGRPEGTFAVWDELLERLLAVPEYVRMLQDAYPGLQFQDITFAHFGNAIAAFEARAFARTDSPFERFVRGDDAALTSRQVRGGLVFYGIGCGACHSGPLLTDQQFHNTGMPQLGPGVNGFTTLLSPVGPDFGRENATGLVEDRYTFRTPSLLNVALTGPWGHAGQFARLEDMVSHYKDIELSAYFYDIQSNVSDPRLVDTRVPNTEAVLATLDPRLRTPLFDFDAELVLEFLRALTDPSVEQLTELVPESVPSGLPVL